MQHVPYKGSPEVMTAMLGGSVNVMFVTPPSVFDLDFATFTSVLRKRHEVLGGWNGSRYAIERAEAAGRVRGDGIFSQRKVRQAFREAGHVDHAARAHDVQGERGLAAGAREQARLRALLGRPTDEAARGRRSPMPTSSSAGSTRTLSS